MLEAFSSVSAAQDHANHLDDCVQALEEQIGNLQAEMVAVHAMKDSTLAWIATKSVSSPGDSSRPVTVDDIQHCRTQREILREYALRNKGYAPLSDVATLVMEAGKARGKRGSVRSTLNNYCRDSDEWLYHEPGVYRLVETIPPEELPEALKRAGATGADESPAGDSEGEPEPRSTDTSPAA